FLIRSRNLAWTFCCWEGRRHVHQDREHHHHDDDSQYDCFAYRRFHRLSAQVKPPRSNLSIPVERAAVDFNIEGKCAFLPSTLLCAIPVWQSSMQTTANRVRFISERFTTKARCVPHPVWSASAIGWLN